MTALGDNMAGIEVLATNLAAKVIAAALPKTIDALAKKSSFGIDRIRVQFTKTFQDHLVWAVKRSRFVKTIVSKDKAVELEKIYVKLSLCSEDVDDIIDDELNPTTDFGLRYIVSGTGGAGKTILMKHLLNLSIDNSLGMIPIFIELRSLDFTDDVPLEQIIFKELEKEGGSESLSLFKAALDEGIFAIFLDGFDEVNPDHADRAIDLIAKFSRRYQKISIVASTRLATGLHTLQDFTVYHLNPLKKDQAIELIKKTKFDTDSKQKFLKSLESNLYDAHPSMLSLPILLVMMLLTFRTYADIPDRMTVFYSQAFETLYSIHDSENKNRFRRVHHSKLPPDLFKKALQAFCYLTLSRHEIEFSESIFGERLQKAIEISGVSAAAADFKNDLVKNVCIIQPDGISYVFVHRSFQEYFASCFALRYSGDKHYEVIDRIVSSYASNVARMMMEQDEALFERVWLLPRLRAFNNAIKSKKNSKIYQKIGIFFGDLWFENGKFRATIGRDDGMFASGIVINSVCDSDLNFASMIKLFKLDLNDIGKDNDGQLRLKNILAIEKSVRSRASSRPRAISRDVIELKSASEPLLARSNIGKLLSDYEDRVENTLNELELRIVRRAKLAEDLLSL